MSRKVHHHKRSIRRLPLQALVLILIIAVAVGLVYVLMRQPQGEPLYYVYSSQLWRISLEPDAEPELVGNVSDFDSRSNWDATDKELIYVADRDKVMRQINLRTGEDTFLFDCEDLALTGRCNDVAIHPDQKRLVYVLTYEDPDIESLTVIPTRIQVYDRTTQEHQLLVEPEEFMWFIDWVADDEIRYTSPFAGTWRYHLTKDRVTQEDDPPPDRLDAADGEHYLMSRATYTGDIFLYSYSVHDADGMELQPAATDYDADMFITEIEPVEVICWQPTGEGVLFHQKLADATSAVNRLAYYDLENNQVQTIHNINMSSDFVTNVMWSADGRYLLYRVHEGVFYYDMQTHMSVPVAIHTEYMLGWLDDTAGCESFTGFPSAE